jgi:hypothetical protein
MKSLLILWPVLCLAACSRQEMQSPVRAPVSEKQPDEWVQLPPKVPPKVLPRIHQVCIGSYADIVRYLGGNSIAISSALLEDGTIVHVRNHISSMVYQAEEKQEDYSLFRSRFYVTHNYWGNVQTASADVWTLGCLYEDSGTGPFTNILYGNFLLKINTGIVWTVPPYHDKGLRVTLLMP